MKIFDSFFDRWRTAQRYEQGYWENVAQMMAEGCLDRIDFYEWRAGEIRKYLERAGLSEILSGSASIVEIGSGPLGVLGYLPAKEKIAVDPLNSFYSSNEHLSRLRKPDVNYISSPGEDIPIESESCDFLIIENCIDHVKDMDGVMSEIRRILKPSGVMYLTVNARCRLGYFIHRFLANLSLDPGHPHTFTENRLKEFLKQRNFQLLDFKKDSWLEAWKGDLRSKETKSKLKATLFVSEFLLTTLSKKI